jgi:hypothetical protein
MHILREKIIKIGMMHILREKGAKLMLLYLTVPPLKKISNSALTTLILFRINGGLFLCSMLKIRNAYK